MPPDMNAVSAAGLPEGVLGDGDGLGDDDGLDEDGAGADGEDESEGDGLGGADPASPDPVPVTVCPGAIVAVPVVTSAREPSGGGARPAAAGA